jgi:hypothetical protein
VGQEPPSLTLLYALVWSTVAIGLVLFDQRSWRNAPREAKVEPVQTGARG